SYVLRTGAHWAGSIGRAEAVVTMDSPIRAEDLLTRDGDWRSTTPGWTLEEGALRWVWEDVEPDFDLHLLMENPHWLNTYRDTRAMLDAGVADRDGVQPVMHATRVLFQGCLSGDPVPLRDGMTSQEAAEALLPDVLAAVRSCMADQPEDITVRENYLALLQDSAVVWRYDAQALDWVLTLLSEARLAYALAELARFASGGELPGYLHAWRPWTQPGLTDYPWQAETQEAIAIFLAAVMPPSFATAADAEKWVTTDAGNALPTGQAAALRTLAMERVRLPAPAKEAEGGATAIVAAAGEAKEPTTGGVAEPTGGVAMMIVGLCLMLGATGTATLWAWHSSRRRARQFDRRREPTDT
uniref:hypothetical protein n=1 Tax=Symbiobacterium terraclitae TaxID=557451 RepID=UPI0035B53199